MPKKQLTRAQYEAKHKAAQTALGKALERTVRLYTSRGVSEANAKSFAFSFCKGYCGQ